MIYVTSDWHFNHDKEFLYVNRGYNNPQDMNEEIIKRHNSIVTPEDDVYFLGDGYLSCTNTDGCGYIQRLNGKIHWIIGNHDTRAKLVMIAQCDNVVDVAFGARIKFEHMHLYLSHYPSLCYNSGNEKPVYNLHGHTHSRDKFELWEHGCYNVGQDAHNCNVVSLKTVVTDIKNMVK